ncbi:MAG: response regulator transcription factor [Myxococcales bacterium]|nr:MAG: response regulator transcription factor [Myxococcales bacterium]
MELLRTEPVLEVVEHAYDVEVPTAAWLESIRRAAESAFEDHVAVQAYTFDVTPEGRFRVNDIASEPFWAELLVRAHTQADRSTIRSIYLGGAVRNVRQILAGRQDDAGYRECVRSGIQEITLSLGMDPGGRGCALVFLQREAKRLSRGTRQALERISAHLASARRLRGGLDAGSSSDQLLSEADAVLTGDGTLLHAERDARDPDAQRALREAARRMDRARCRGQGASPDEALGLWRALVDGRWSLIERFESDGRRVLVARQNPPRARKHRALSEQEQKVVALLALGHSVKLCAYELGRAESTTSEIARSALRKLGLSSRAELLEMHGALMGAEAQPQARSAPCNGD